MVSILLPSLLLLGACLACWWGGGVLFNVHAHPSDQALIDNFYAHRNEFDQLLEMFRTDAQFLRIAPTFTIPSFPQFRGDAVALFDPPFSQARWNDYRVLFRTLNLEAGISGRRERDRVWILASVSGWMTSGSYKGYIYSIMPLEPIVENLDNASKRSNEEIYRYIESNWYLYYDR